MSDSDKQAAYEVGILMFKLHNQVCALGGWVSSEVNLRSFLMERLDTLSDVYGDAAVRDAFQAGYEAASNVYNVTSAVLHDCFA